jgi:heme/copper-type cytochrome/quinol oxidase subunit 4
MTSSKIKILLRLRLLCFFLSIAFTGLTVTFSYGKQVMHWEWAGSVLMAGACVTLALASCIVFLFLNKKLESNGL